jgi:hypothetical protein
VHRWASCAIVPAFVTEFALGQSLYGENVIVDLDKLYRQDQAPEDWAAAVLSL